MNSRTIAPRTAKGADDGGPVTDARRRVHDIWRQQRGVLIGLSVASSSASPTRSLLCVSPRHGSSEWAGGNPLADRIDEERLVVGRA